MKVYLITVRPPISTGGRYFDSIWVVKNNAEERKDQLMQEMKRSGFKVTFTPPILDAEWYVTITEALANDGRIADNEPTK